MPVEYVGQAATNLLTIFRDTLRAFPSLENDVQGFSEFGFLGYSNRTPIQIKNLLGPKFSRDFTPQLKSAIEGLKTDPALNKKALHSALLEKYFGITINQNAFFAPTTLSNAYHSLPDEADIDYQLHLFYLQPYKLFSISENNRKFINRADPNVNRQWCWEEGARGDIAPILRKMIQLYLISDILQDYEMPDSEYANADVQAKLDQLKTLNSSLLEQIRVDLGNFFHFLRNDDIAIHDPNAMRGNPNGLLSGATPASFDMLLPGFMDIASFYPIGRLMLGQTRSEAHHTVAERAINPARHSIIQALNYAFVFLFSHLNLSTSLFWIKVGLKTVLGQWQAFKDFVSNRPDSRAALILQTLLFVPNLLILVASPLLILLPALYGVTSLPFSFLRFFCMHGPFQFLKHYRVLKTLDAFELIKDSALFFIYAIPILTLLVASVNALLPSIVLSIGTWTSYFFLVCIETAFTDHHYYYYNAVDPLFELASTHFFQLFGAGLFLGTGTYLGSAYVGRALNDHLPTFVKRIIAAAFSPINSLIHKFELAIKNMLTSKSDLDLKTIISGSERQPNLAIPKVSVLIITEEKQAEIDAMMAKLGKLNQAFYLSPERKAQIRERIGRLDITPETTQDSLNASLNAANTFLADCLSIEETSVMIKVIQHLEQEDPSLAPNFRMEKFFINQAANAGIYQPSWKLLQILQDKELIRDGQWQGPAQLTLSEATLAKCQRIQALKPVAAAPLSAPVAPAIVPEHTPAPVLTALDPAAAALEISPAPALAPQLALALAIAPPPAPPSSVEEVPMQPDAPRLDRQVVTPLTP